MPGGVVVQEASHDSDIEWRRTGDQMVFGREGWETNR